MARKLLVVLLIVLFTFVWTGKPAEAADVRIYKCDPFLCNLSRVTDSGHIISLRYATESRIGGLTRHEFLAGNSIDWNLRIQVEVELWEDGRRVADFIGYPEKLFVSDLLYIVQTYNGYFMYSPADELIHWEYPGTLALLDVYGPFALFFDSISGHLYRFDALSENVYDQFVDLGSYDMRTQRARLNNQGDACIIRYNQENPAQVMDLKCGDNDTQVVNLPFAGAYLYGWSARTEVPQLVFIARAPEMTYAGDKLVVDIYEDIASVRYSIPDPDLVDQIVGDMILGVMENVGTHLYRMVGNNAISVNLPGKLSPIQIVNTDNQQTSLLVYRVVDLDVADGAIMGVITIPKH